MFWLSLRMRFRRGDSTGLHFRRRSLARHGGRRMMGFVVCSREMSSASVFDKGSGPLGGGKEAHSSVIGLGLDIVASV